MLYHVLCNHGHGPLYCLRKQKQNKRNIKSRKINKKKRKMFKSRCTITLLIILVKIFLVQFYSWFWRIHSIFSLTSLRVILIFFSFSHMLSLCFSYWGFCLLLSNCFFITSFVFFINDFAISQLLCSFLRKVSNFSNSVFIVRFPFHGCLV